MRRATYAIAMLMLSLGCGSRAPRAPEQPTAMTAGNAAAGNVGAGMSAATPMAGTNAPALPTGGTLAPPSGGASGGAGSAGREPSIPAADAAVAQPDAGAPEPTGSAGCQNASPLATGSARASLQHGGEARSYIVHVPSGLATGSPVALVLDFHGNGGSASQQQSSSGWQALADREHFIVVYPEGISGSWNVGNCCGVPFERNVDDVGFARAIVAQVKQDACVDPRRVYATGLSNGAGLCHRIACEAADVFAAIAAASADLVTDPCTPARPISELSVRGESDFLVAYAGGNVGSTGWYSPGAKGTLALWKDIDGCTGSAELQLEYCETYTQCRDGVEISLCSLPGVGHILYDNRLGFDVPETAWAMFKRQPMR